MNKARLLILAAAGLVLASCGHQTLNSDEYESWLSEHSSAQPSSQPSENESESEDPSDSEDTEDTVDTEDTGDTGESTDTEQSSDSGEEEEYLYFREATWWNDENVDVRIALDPTLDTTPETMINYADMEYLRYVYHDDDDRYCYYAIALSSLEGVETIQFWRYGYEKGATDPTYWGAQTIALTLAERGENNMYDIHGVDKPAAWQEGAPADASREVTGVWGVYDPTDEGVEPPAPTSSEGSEPSGEEVTYEVTGIPTWITNDGCIIFAWAWAEGEGAWYSCEYTAFKEEHATALEFTTPTEMKGLLLVRCVAGTETPDWSIKTGDAAGRIYNKTNDIAVAAGVHTFEAPESIWVEYK